MVMILSPFPGFLFIYLLSITGIYFRQYLLGRVAGIIPSIANLLFIGNEALDVGVVVLFGTVLARWAGWLPLFVKLLCVIYMVAVSVYVTSTMLDTFRNAGGVVQ